jgi:hypothetical protein
MSRGASVLRCFAGEPLLAYLDFLPTAFLKYGLPLEFYVDYHSLFFSAPPEAFTQLSWALRFCGVHFRCAPTPRAKAKIERGHQVWQARLPAYFASETISDLEQANLYLQHLRLHRNEHEVHHEPQMKLLQAWQLAQKEKRSALRPVPRCPWRPFVWSIRSTVKVGPDGRAPIGPQRLRVQAAPGTKVVRCQHTTAHHSVLRESPRPNTKPIILLSTRPK